MGICSKIAGLLRREHRCIRLPLLIDEPQVWEESDAMSFHTFLYSSMTGVKIRELLCYSVLQRSCSTDKKDDFEQGKVAGRKELYAEIMTLSTLYEHGEADVEA